MNESNSQFDRGKETSNMNSGTTGLAFKPFENYLKRDRGTVIES